jgi:hypothetical protein
LTTAGNCNCQTNGSARNATEGVPYRA